MKVIFAGGGTGGHLYPSLAVAEELKNKNVEMLFLVSDRGIDSRILMRSGFHFIEQDVAAFMGKGILSKVKAVYKLVKSIFKVYPLINKGDKVFITGGFASAPAAIVAKIKGSELYLHEQNSVMGLVNRTFARVCKKVFLSFDNTRNAKGLTIVSGNPVRKEFREISEKEGWNGRILVMGGSQGSRKINSIIVSAIDFLMKEGFTVIHQTGEGLLKETVSLYGNAVKRYAPSLSVLAYIDGPAYVIKSSDIVVGRAGAGMVFELMSAGVPAIYIPFKAASENHQYYNAKAASDKGCALILEEDDATPEKFIETVKLMKENIETFRLKLKDNKPKDSVKIIVDEMGLSATLEGRHQNNAFVRDNLQ